MCSSDLGTNLIEASASSSFGSQNPTLPEDAVDQAYTVRTVQSVSAVVELTDIIVLPYEEATEKYETVPVPVLASDAELAGVLQVPMVSGRWLNSFDEHAGARAAVIGLGLAQIGGAAHKPARKRRVAVVADLLGRRLPIDQPGLGGPEVVALINGLAVKLGITGHETLSWAGADCAGAQVLNS